MIAVWLQFSYGESVLRVVSLIIFDWIFCSYNVVFPPLAIPVWGQSFAGQEIWRDKISTGVFGIRRVVSSSALRIPVPTPFPPEAQAEGDRQT